MTTLTRAKISLAVAGLVLFGAGVRWERAELRYAGIAFVLAAWLLRFVKRHGRNEDEPEGE